MPIYEYRCKKCGAEFEQMRNMADMDKRSKCPKCASRAIARRVSMSFAIVSGSGGGDFDLGDMGDMGGMPGGMPAEDDFGFDDDF